MKIVKVKTKSKNYNVYVGSNILSSKSFRELENKKVVIIADKKAFNLHKTKINNVLRNTQKTDYIVLPFSENNKTVDYTLQICEKLISIGADRDSLLVAVGGGVTGDIVGFVASVYMRGISYVHVPTTLLAQADSSIGGKTGVNLSTAKNVFGTITQPEAVITDTLFLETLLPKQIKEGLAEIIKYAITQNSKLFNFLEDVEKVDNKMLEKIVFESIKMKSKIVSEDERENGLREVLNFGHTVGHSIEICSKHKVSHGQAVSIGMVIESMISVELGFLKATDYQRIISVLSKYKMPTKNTFNVGNLIQIMKNDKKNKDGKIMFVLPNKIGGVVEKSGKYSINVDLDIIEKCLS